jgi:hypothetical protein
MLGATIESGAGSLEIAVGYFDKIPENGGLPSLSRGITACQAIGLISKLWLFLFPMEKR